MNPYSAAPRPCLGCVSLTLLRRRYPTAKIWNHLRKGCARCPKWGTRALGFPVPQCKAQFDGPEPAVKPRFREEIEFGDGEDVTGTAPDDEEVYGTYGRRREEREPGDSQGEGDEMGGYSDGDHDGEVDPR